MAGTPKKRKRQRVSTGKRVRPRKSEPVFQSYVRVVGEDGAVSYGTGPCFTLVFQRRGDLKREKGPRGVRRRREPSKSVVWHVPPLHVHDKGGKLAGRDEVAKQLREKGQLLGFRTEKLHPKTVVDGILDYLRGQEGGNIIVTAVPGEDTLKEEYFASAMGKMRELLDTYKKEGLIDNVRTRGLSSFRGTGDVYVDRRGRINRGLTKPLPGLEDKNGKT